MKEENDTNRDATPIEQLVKELSLCSHCRGRRVPESTISGSMMRHRLLNADPENFGLEPFPPALDGEADR